MGKKANTHFQYRSYVASLMTLLVGMSACEQPTTFIPGHTDRFIAHNEDAYAQAQQILQADYLFVLDYGYGMSNGNASQSGKLAQLTNAMAGFTQSLSDQNIDYNIGFVKGTTHAGSASTIASDFVAPFINLDSSVLGLDNQIIDQISPVGGELQENRNYLLEAALRTMKAQSSSFVRSAAQLVYVFVSDTDDESQYNSRISGAKSVDYYTNALLNFKSDRDYISARSFTAGVASDCDVQKSWESEGTRIASVAQAVDSLSYEPQCVYTPMAESLDGLARDVTRTTSRFTLRGIPQDGTVRVFIDGSEVSSSGNWSYLEASNEVVFEAGQEPAPSSQLTIEYKMLYKLSKTPNPSSISVTIEGASIQKSSSNGWTYNSTENRVEFHGSAIPAHDADVRISYTQL